MTGIKTSLAFTGLLFIPLLGLSQKVVPVLTNTIHVGKDYRTGATIQGTAYTLPDRIQEFLLDTIHHCVTIKVRGLSNDGKRLDNSGDVVRYDLQQQKVLWSKHVSYQKEYVKQFGGMTVHSNGKKSYCLHNETGEHLWEVKNSILFSDPASNIGVGYKYESSADYEDVLEGIDLTNGKAIWKRYINREYGWNDIRFLDDSTLLIAAAGLHTVNMHDGTGWNYNTVTGTKDYTASAVGTGLGIAAGLLTGTYYVASGANLVKDIASNVIVDSAHIYMASKEHITKLDRKGHVIWKTTLPEKMTSQSWIFISGEDILMVNKGSAFMGSRQLDIGEPFVASFQLETGNKNYQIPVHTKKKEMIGGYTLLGDTLLLVFSDRIAMHSVNDGSLIQNKLFNTVHTGELRWYIGEQVYVKNDSSYTSLVKMDAAKRYVYTDKQKILVLNEELEIQNEIPNDDIYIYHAKWKNLKCIANDQKTFVLDEKGQLLFDLPGSDKLKLMQGKLYTLKENHLTEIDLDKLIRDLPN